MEEWPTPRLHGDGHKPQIQLLTNPRNRGQRLRQEHQGFAEHSLLAIGAPFARSSTTTSNGIQTTRTTARDHSAKSWGTVLITVYIRAGIEPRSPTRAARRSRYRILSRGRCTESRGKTRPVHSIALFCQGRQRHRGSKWGESLL